MNNFDAEFIKKFKIAYNNLIRLHPKPDEEDFKYIYLKSDWFFPNHINNVLFQIKNLAVLYFPDINLEASLYAGLFHDAGLVYKRDSASPVGHENRSTEYAENELLSLGYKKDFIDIVIECIKSTEPSYNSSQQEAILVRNADAYAHIISMHFFAKANFNKNIHSFIDWFEDKIHISFSKISILELKQEIMPIVSSYEKMIKNYRDNKDEKNFLDRLFS